MKHTTRAKKVTTSVVRTQMGSLEEWAKVVGDQQVLAVRPSRSETTEEFWLAKPTGAAFAVPEDMVHATDQFEKDWIVVPIRWYDRYATNERAFRLLKEDKLLLVATTVRLANLKFSSKAKGKYTITQDTAARILGAL